MSVSLFARQSLALATRVFPHYPAGMQLFADGFGKGAFERYRSSDKFHFAYVGGMHRLNPFLHDQSTNGRPSVETLTSRLTDSPDSERYRQFVSDHGISDMVVMTFREGESHGDTVGWLAHLIPQNVAEEELKRVLSVARDLFPYVQYNLGRRLTGAPSTHVAAFVASMNLSRRESEVARLVSAGLCNKEIAARLNLAVPTVKSHITGILARTGLKNRIELIGLVNTGKPVV